MNFFEYVLQILIYNLEGFFSLLFIVGFVGLFGFLFFLFQDSSPKKRFFSVWIPCKFLLEVQTDTLQ